jgi:hypothetical protein
VNPYNVKVGQVWRSWDSRLQEVSDYSEEAGRFRVIEIDLKMGTATVERLRPKHGVSLRRKIRLNRFRPNSTGYKLLEDVPTPKYFMIEEIRQMQEPSMKTPVPGVEPMETIIDPPIQKTQELPEDEVVKLCDHPNHDPSCTGDPSGVECAPINRPLADDEVLVIEVKP